MGTSILKIAALGQGRAGLQPTQLPRDLYQIAELTEVCFADSLDSNGRAAIREMKAFARTGPLVWLAGLLDQAGSMMGTGFVWREGGRVIGNVSLYHGGAHPQHGPGALIANVAVHPDFRRRGIARALMQAVLAKLARHKAKWVSLQVEADNSAAIALYENLGFKSFEMLTHWECQYFEPLAPLVETPERWLVRRRRPEDQEAEIDLVLGRARQGGMSWTRPLERADLLDGPLETFGALLEGHIRQRWVLSDPNLPGYLLGTIWVETSGIRSARISLFLDPLVAATGAAQALASPVLMAPTMENRRIRIETESESAQLSVLLTRAGFRVERRLLQMRLHL